MYLLSQRRRRAKRQTKWVIIFFHLPYIFTKTKSRKELTDFQTCQSLPGFIEWYNYFLEFMIKAASC